MSSGHAAFHVLIVDDSRDVADSLAIVLALRGLDVSKAYDGRTALTLARERAPDAVILDLVLPDIDGYSLAQAFRADPDWRDIALIAYTGDGTAAARQRCAAVGIDVYVLKPADPAQLGDLAVQCATPGSASGRRLRLVGVRD